MLRPISFALLGLLTACTSVETLDRPNPDYVVTFNDMSFNNSPTLIKEFEASQRLLLVGVSDKNSAHKASEDLKSVIATFDEDKDLYVAYRITNMPTETRVVEIFDASDIYVPSLLANLKTGSIDQYGRWFSESEMRRFESEIYSKSISLSDYFTLQSQLAALLQNFGWSLLDFGAFVSTEHTPYFPKNIKFEATTLEPMKATKSEVGSLIRSWSSNYKDLYENYLFEIDIATQTVSYEKKKTNIETLKEQIDELF
ncbi:hypothetical protein [Pseudoalteromonas sp. SR41-6]|uniref:hypothetical protein n=1 Tax=Pseudoalteromonas sp. SR41-6 TaxID=2760948 RepID=UPI001604715B|nr:hypothetical protein [Pseudoalteromonas sp. SR41-6]MBB1334006.1 hypothetical protein [Pseudoalteromonas sp. SR41-6]